MRIAGVNPWSDLFLFRAIVRTKEGEKLVIQAAGLQHTSVVQKEIGGIGLPSKVILTP